MSQKYIRPEEACKKLQVSNETLKRWAKAGKIDFIRTEGGHRRYDISKIYPDESKSSSSADRQCICYARVSSSSQKEDLERQAEYLSIRFPNYKIIKDVGSGLNFKRKGFKAILGLALRGEIQQLVVTYKDRLCRFGFELLSAIIQHHHGSILVLNTEADSTPEHE